jgi:hypothetical protein
MRRSLAGPFAIVAVAGLRRAGAHRLHQRRSAGLRLPRKTRAQMWNVAKIVTVLLLTATFLDGCTRQAIEPAVPKQRMPFYDDPPDPYHYRQPFQAG